MRGKFTSGAVGGVAGIEPPTRAIAAPFQGTAFLGQIFLSQAFLAQAFLARTFLAQGFLSRVFLGHVVLSHVVLSHVFPSHVLVSTASSERCVVGATPDAGFRRSPCLM